MRAERELAHAELPGQLGAPRAGERLAAACLQRATVRRADAGTDPSASALLRTSAADRRDGDRAAPYWRFAGAGLPSRERGCQRPAGLAQQRKPVE
ncbi:uncharacterized protein SOCEGT47_071980 [Sorangium cellulosum]|uniref:Uncharacterized protein n=1 Tax=Sorangium cellulosum TaxID=56 RepID=A0A4P2QBD4_SORCE|nr:uncharacterized protein SOCEGT47_071980 [Sorangium cellulosum]